MERGLMANLYTTHSSRLLQYGQNVGWWYC